MTNVVHSNAGPVLCAGLPVLCAGLLTPHMFRPKVSGDHRAAGLRPAVEQLARSGDRATTRRPFGPRIGFTLLEVILALSMTVVVMAAIGVAIHLHLRSGDKTRVGIERDQLARTLMRRIADDIRAAVRREPFDDAGLQALMASTRGPPRPLPRAQDNKVPPPPAAAGRAVPAPLERQTRRELPERPERQPPSANPRRTWPRRPHKQLVRPLSLPAFLATSSKYRSMWAAFRGQMSLPAR